MFCETCEMNHDGSYGSGRFCCLKCARAFSTKAKRSQINERVSKTLKGRSSPIKGKKTGARPLAVREKISQSSKLHYKLFPKVAPLTEEQKRARNVAHVMKYRAKKRDAIRADSDLELIKLIYENCPTGYHVDHIVALACGGSHHQDNLQYLPADENRRKGKKSVYDTQVVIDWRSIVKSSNHV